MRKGNGLLAVLMGLLLMPLLAGTARSQMLINGAGSTFGYPIYSKWFDAYTKVDPSVRFNYQSIGSGGGIMMLRNQTVDIGASDAPLNAKQSAMMPGPVLHFPSVLGAVVLMYDLPGITTPVRLTGPVIADIYLGNIVKWTDPAIAKLNPGVNFPDDPIVTVHRSDGSGTSYIYSDYLSKVSPEWASKVGRGTSLKWPVGLGGKGSEGVTGLVQQTPGAMGYCELTYALANKISFATVQNADGKWIVPSLGGVTAAAAGAAANMPADFRVSITNAPGADTYPISSFTWLLVYSKETDKAKSAAIVKFLKWALTDGQKYAAPLFYAPLPAEVVQKELKQISEITTN
ncbi:MAG: phosphate ABC transporter substrate-binding protein PstS [Candidatus Binataceae bacterium]|nr:phosphate ABC transporter substrate-binding protein PstS [Candidatus Binataceae bacterium]